MSRRPNPLVARPACPQHAGSRVIFDGLYGKPSHRRQQYRCFPADGSPSHRFTPLLPRQRPASGECLHCERRIHAHEGPPTARHFQFTTREVARVLVELGKGRSYREVAAEVRDAAGRPTNGSGHLDGRLAGDWVELFVPSLELAYGEREWPSSIAVDCAPFRIPAKDAQGNPLPGGSPAFNVFAASENRTDSRGRSYSHLVLLRVYPGRYIGQTAGDWLDFFRQLNGTPERVVCDGERDILTAVKRAWPASAGPSPLVWYCHHHLKERMLGMLLRDGVHYSDPLYEQADKLSFMSSFHWQRFKSEAGLRPLRSFERWLKKWEPVLDFQVGNIRGLTAATGGVEQKLQVVERHLDYRRHVLLNRERTNRLLFLIQLQENRQASETRYAKLIREFLEANSGRAGQRQLIADRSGRPSLRV